MNSKTKDVHRMDETVVSEALTRQVATILLGGASPADCAKQLSISPAAVRRIQQSDKFKELVTQTAEDELAPALAKAKAQLARLTTKAVAAIEKALDTAGHKEALQAAGIVLRAAGLNESEEKESDTTINVIVPMAGQAAPITYEVDTESEGGGTGII